MTIADFYRDKVVLVTGCCGTVGRELTRQFTGIGVLSSILGIDNNESELFFVDQNFGAKEVGRFVLADVRDECRMADIMKGVDIVFHTAAFKHVILCERSPFEAVQTNILGVQHVIQGALANGIEKVVFTSSDKAVNPTNVMGTSKLMGERLMSAADANRKGDRPAFVSTRFGNVLGSRGSVIPIFREQIREGGPVTVTSPEMTRFIMSIEEAVRLVIDSAALARGGEVFVTKMPVIRILDLAEVMIRELGPRYGHQPEDIEIKVIGTKPGEKMYEELMSQEEVRRALELDRYFVVLPALHEPREGIETDYGEILSRKVTNPYNSANEAPLTQEALRKFLFANGLIEESEGIPHPARRHWPDF